MRRIWHESRAVVGCGGGGGGGGGQLPSTTLTKFHDRRIHDRRDC